MKKILFALLIVFVVSTTVQTEDLDLEGWKDIWRFIQSLTGEAKKIYNWLKAHGYWDQIVDLVKKAAVPAAISACSGYTGQPVLCATIINALAAFIK